MEKMKSFVDIDGIISHYDFGRALVKFEEHEEEYVTKWNRA